LYGSLNKKKLDEVQKLLGCGKFKNGFQRYTSPRCDTAMVMDGVFSFHSEKIFKQFLSTHRVTKGYLIPNKRAGPLEDDKD